MRNVTLRGFSRAFAVVDALGIADLLAIDIVVDERAWFTEEIQGIPPTWPTEQVRAA